VIVEVVGFGGFVGSGSGSGVGEGDGVGDGMEPMGFSSPTNTGWLNCVLSFGSFMALVASVMNFCQIARG
jgi:hypothetical protein